MNRGRWALVGLTLASSVSGLWNGFTFDDEPIIMANPHIHFDDWHKVLRVFASPYWPPELGGNLYRPLTMLVFGTEWWAGHGSPFVFHAVNIALYVAVVLAVYALATRCLPPSHAWAAWVAAALFAIHPVHVEVVGNIVGQAELMAALTVVTAVAWYLRCRAEGHLTGRDIAGLTALYLAGCLIKEHAVMLPILLAVAEFTIVDDRGDRKALRPLGLALIGTALVYLGVRAAVLHAAVGEIPAVEFWKASIATRGWTMLAVAGQWLRLLLWPARLSAVYSPPEVPVLDGPAWVALPALLALVIGIAIIIARRRSALAFGLAWAAVCLLPTSNVLVPTGVFLAERTLFLPSVGIVIAIAAGAAAIADTGWAMPRWAAVGILALVLALGVWRSAIRQVVWHDDAYLFAMTVREDPRSYAAHFERARTLLASGQHDEGVAEAERAEQLYDRDPDLAGVLGRVYAAAGRCEAAVPLLRQAVDWMPSRPNPRARLARCLQQLGQ